jgi:hypothetical protein
MAQQDALAAKQEQLERELASAKQKELEEELERAEIEEKRLQVAASLESGEIPASAALEPGQEKDRGIMDAVNILLGSIPAATRQAVTVGAVKGPGAGLSAGLEQLKSLEPEQAITGAEQAALLGASTQKPAEVRTPYGPAADLMPYEEAADIASYQAQPPSPAELASLPLELAQDPTGLAVRTAALAGRGAAAVARPVVRGAAAGLSALAKPAIEKTAEEAGKAIGTVASIAAKEAKAPVRAAVQSVGEGVVKLPKTVLDYISNLKPSIRPQFEEQVKLGARYGVDPALLSQSRELLYGPNQFVTNIRAAARQVEGGRSAKILEKTHEQIQGAIDDITGQLSRGVGVLGREGTGAAIRDAYDAAVSDLFAQNQFRYSKVADALRVKQISPEEAKRIQSATDPLLQKLQDISLKSERTIRFSTDPSRVSQARANQSSVNRILDTLQQGDVAATIEQMQEIGQDAFKAERFLGEPGPDKKLLRELYSDLKKVVETNVSVFDAKLGEELKASNAALSDFFRKNELIGRTLQSKAIPDEKVFENLILAGNSKKLDGLLGIIGQNEEAVGAVRGQFLESLQAKSGLDETIPVSTMKALNQDKNRRIAQRLFAEGELDDFSGMVTMAKDVGVINFNPGKAGIVASVVNAAQTATRMGLAKEAATLLEAQALQQHLQGASLGDLIALKDKGIYPAEVIDSLIKQRAASPIGETLKRSLSQGEMIGEVGDAAAKMVSEAYANDSWNKATNFLRSLAMELGESAVPMNLPSDRVSKAMTLYNYTFKKNNAENPVRVPAEDIAEVKAYIDQSNASPMLKARNKLMLDQAGILLNPGQFTNAEPVMPQKAKTDETKRSVDNQQLYNAFRDVMRASPRPEVEAEKPR